MSGDVNVRTINQQNSDVAWSRFEFTHPFQEKERFEDANSQRVIQVDIRLLDGSLHVSTQRGGYAIEHPVKSRKAAHFIASHPFDHALEDFQHGAFTHGGVLASKGVMLGKLLNRALKQIEVIGMEGIKGAELITATPALVLN